MAPQQSACIANNVRKTKYNTFGAPAPRGTIKKPSGPPTTNSRTKKVIPKSSIIPKGGSLACINSGERIIDQGVWCSNSFNGGTVVRQFRFARNALILEPYTFLTKTTTSRQLWPRIITSPVAIISIHLEGMNDIPSLLAYHHLHDWLHGNVVHVGLDFHLCDVPHNDFESQLDTMLAAFERKGQFEGWTQFMVIVMTHSDLDTGFPHIAPNNGASVPAEETSCTSCLSH
ncbi:uncharacterized protein LACBIDRAFT_308512 [Laccaria bicolor S238N-H82]|uniref:Predicted protein n=1 Tax=Laccaria bicolor (strain S238N-H82 / ATCC MYA-4686) TaxID=486041 RepID=B0CWI6_LACBS|nr:uncharacterized protein LACBIDRAFT_308512 [Laccaria bicolor S238N-H82]EDR13074.1 predicted protein [Laccaria bicolor S238N-H82]|eukprot:XP_001875572.1 predicted protein [Laccaria bicolor S238N-H82]